MTEPTPESLSIAHRYASGVAECAREIEQRVAAAVQEEREYCARVADNAAEDYQAMYVLEGFPEDLRRKGTAVRIATLIRRKPADRPGPEDAVPILCAECGQPGSLHGVGKYGEPVCPILDLARPRCSTPSQEYTGCVGGEKLWLWKNGDHYLAFAHEYPTYGGGDPMVLGEPLGYAMLVPSEPRRAEPPTDAGGPGSASNTESSPTQTVAAPGPTAGDVERARSMIYDAANILGGPEAGMLCKGIAVALAAERASARAELLAQIREPNEKLVTAMLNAFHRTYVTHDGPLKGALRTLADKLTEAK